MNKEELEECAKQCENYDEFCEKCGDLINKSDYTAQEAWDIICDAYGEI